MDGEAPQTKPLLLLPWQTAATGGGIDVTSKPDDGLFVSRHRNHAAQEDVSLPKLVNDRVFDIRHFLPPLPLRHDDGQERASTWTAKWFGNATFQMLPGSIQRTGKSTVRLCAGLCPRLLTGLPGRPRPPRFPPECVKHALQHAFSRRGFLLPASISRRTVSGPAASVSIASATWRSPCLNMFRKTLRPWEHDAHSALFNAQKRPCIIGAYR